MPKKSELTKEDLETLKVILMNFLKWYDEEQDVIINHEGVVRDYIDDTFDWPEKK